MYILSYQCKAQKLKYHNTQSYESVYNQLKIIILNSHAWKERVDGYIPSRMKHHGHRHNFQSVGGGGGGLCDNYMRSTQNFFDIPRVSAANLCCLASALEVSIEHR